MYHAPKIFLSLMMPLIGESLDFIYFKQQCKASLEQFYIF